MEARLGLVDIRATLENGSLFEDRYEILGELGSGSFGCVYQARQLSTGQSVAIKLLSLREELEESMGREAERFRRETQICAALAHTNIVQLIDSGETQDGQLYAVFAYLPGETLKQALTRDGALDVRESMRLMTQVLDALACAHAKGIVHRDLKPANVMVSGTGARRNAVVLDFGLGGVADGRRRAEWQTLTQTREFLGTPLYAAPEQLAGETPTERADLYAWGLIFLECLTGQHPFADAGGMERLLTGGGAVEIPEWLRGHRLGGLLERVTNREPANRDVPVESLIEALDEIVRGELPVPPQEMPIRAPLPGTGERRHLTVMFCDLFGSTALSQQLDAETYREIVHAYQARGSEAVERYAGHIAQYLGDGLLVYFGYPQAHEDDAERAIRAGLELLRGLEVLSAQTEARQGVAIQARVGIHTGSVVVGEMGGREKQEVLALGDTPNIAARLEGFAEPGTVVVSDATLRLVPGLFVTEDRGTPALKGIEESIRVHRVGQPSGVRSRLERAPGLTPFVGREQELGLLLDRFEQAQEGLGQVVLVGGEAGIGKSRLVRELRGRLREKPHTWLECRSSPYTRNSALYPVIELVEHALGSADDHSAEEKLGRLEEGLAHVGLESAQILPLFASLLSLRLPERYAPLEISPQLQRQRTLEALLSWVIALSEKHPLVLLVEDLQWIDPSTLEWLALLIEQCPTARVLLLMTHRPHFEPPWPSRTHLLPMGLIRLSRRQAKELVARATPASTLPETLLDAIAEHADGVPLFMEEMAKGIVASGHEIADSLSDIEIPETLWDSLTAQLDRLGEAKEVAQLGAVLGREFPYALLEAVAPVKQSELREGLGRLVDAELLFQRGLPPRANYTFKHALVQDAAYQSLLESQRRELHARIADALEERFPERVAREPEVVAHHCEEAGRIAQAIGHYQQAGTSAWQRWAAAEAIVHSRKALALLGTLPESRERNGQELPLQHALADAIIVAKGQGDPDVERIYERARSLCQKIGETPWMFDTLLGLSFTYSTRGQERIAYELAEQALVLAERSAEPLRLAKAHTSLGISLHHLCEPTRALEHLEQAIDLFDRVEDRTRVDESSIPPRGYAAHVLWLLGHPDRARSMSREAVELAREEDPYTLAAALILTANVHLGLGERDRAREQAEEVIAIGRERGFPDLEAMGTGCRGLALGGARGLEELQRGKAQFAATRVETISVARHWSLAEANLNRALGRTEQALAVLEPAFATESGARNAGLHQEKGEILVQRGTTDEAEHCFRRALEIARKQEAKSLELRTATSLACLLRDQGQGEEARMLLQPVYDWFTEGFDTADLKEAKALLEELS